MLSFFLNFKRKQGELLEYLKEKLMRELWRIHGCNRQGHFMPLPAMAEK
jgi:hypothetical protein